MLVSQLVVAYAQTSNKHKTHTHTNWRVHVTIASVCLSLAIPIIPRSFHLGIALMQHNKNGPSRRSDEKKTLCILEYTSKRKS